MSSEGSIVKTNPCILIVDDDSANLFILQVTFEEKGYRVLAARNVDEAQQVLVERAHEIDLVLSDIQMPGKTGFDLVRWAKENQSRLPEIPILLITSQLPDPENRIFGLSLGAVDYIVRSIDSREVELRVSHAIDHFSQLRSLRAGLEDSENLASLGRLLAASNHEIRNLAQIAKTATDILQSAIGRSVGIDQIGEDALSAVRRSTDLLADMSKSMGHLIAKDQTKPSLISVSLADEVQAVLGMMRPLMKNCFFELNLGDPALGIWAAASPMHLKQILINLLMNARDAMGEINLPVGGCVTIAVTPSPHDRVTIRIKDNGVGLPAKESRSEFQPFASTKQLRGGTGLGLWLSARFATAMGGSLKLQSNGPGKGAEATLELHSAKRVAPIDISNYLSD